MDVITSLETMTTKLDRIGRTSVGFIMTKGALHEGHKALIKTARTENKIVIVSSFVHPHQFLSPEALELYPRTPGQDIELATQSGADFFLCPSYEELYPRDASTYIGSYSTPMNRLEGEIHPKYYQSFLTTAALFLNCIRPQRLYTSEKDFQKNELLQQLIKDFHYNCEIRVLPTLREEDGLIIGSRNTLLELEERRLAPTLYRALKKAELAYQRGNISSYKLKLLLETEIRRYYRIQIEYIEVLDVERLISIETILGEALIAMGVRIGKVRLADYIYLKK